MPVEHSDNLAARGMRPISELAASRPHGDRLRYRAGCRCSLCRTANTQYEAQRQRARKAGDWNGIVSAKRAKAHLLTLSRHGVGRRAVGAASDVGDTCLSQIRCGEKTRIRARTERRILAVTPAMASDRALVPSRDTIKRIRQLLAEGYSEQRLAHELGLKTGRLQYHAERVTVRTAYRIERLHKRLTE
ncbi:MAG: hypothetical protein CVV18_00335 [Gammaproteobacteria bacterium HGW-Gammaproteobacteria-8]|jgi:hypothetical protein|nr:MAG: hypothetical protein CVV18_00335 [Gammaproteobacteria bacterium HGW-Gammaproteobacteria-8]